MRLAMRQASLIGAALLAVATAACSPGETDKAAETPAEAVLPPGREAIYAAAAEGPEPFVRALYAVYVAGGPKETPPAPGQDPIYSRMLNAAIITDFHLAKGRNGGEVPTLNYDPICDCQDQGVFTLDSLAVTSTGERTADAAVAFTNAGETRRQTLKLIKEGPMWRVVDVVGADGRSLNDTLIKAIEAQGG